MDITLDEAWRIAEQRLRFNTDYLMLEGPGGDRHSYDDAHAHQYLAMNAETIRGYGDTPAEALLALCDALEAEGTMIKGFTDASSFDTEIVGP